jgi:hypothetical protein
LLPQAPLAAVGAVAQSVRWAEGVGEAKRLRALARENVTLKKLLAEAELEKCGAGGNSGGV